MAKQMKNPTLSGRRWQLYVLLAPFLIIFSLKAIPAITKSMPSNFRGLKFSLKNMQSRTMDVTSCPISTTMVDTITVDFFVPMTRKIRAISPVTLPR